MNQSERENTLLQERLHWAIFTLPLATILALLLATLPGVAFVRFMIGAFGQLAPHATSVLGDISLLALVLPQILVALPLLLVTAAAYAKSTITLTDRRLIFRTGLLARTAGELPLENIEAIILSESLLARLLGYGTVTVTSVGGLRFPLPYMPAPQNFHATLQKAVATAKSPSKPVRKAAASAADDDSRYMPKG